MTDLQLITALLAFHAFMGILTWWFLRGGGIESSVLNYRNVPHLKPIAALIFGVDFAYFCKPLGFITNFPLPDLFQALITGGSMLLGSSPGWGKYIAAMAGNSKTGKSKRWGLLMMTLRGLFLGCCVALTWLVGAPVWFSIAILMCGGLMGPVYYLSFNHIKAQGKVFNAWTVAEMVFGWLFWVPLAILAIKAKKAAKKKQDNVVR